MDINNLDDDEFHHLVQWLTTNPVGPGVCDLRVPGATERKTGLSGEAQSESAENGKNSTLSRWPSHAVQLEYASTWRQACASKGVKLGPIQSLSDTLVSVSMTST